MRPLYRSIGDAKDKYVKRVTALADDLVYADDGELVRIPWGHCWIEGDNAPVSLDSNDFGAVPSAHFVG